MARYAGHRAALDLLYAARAMALVLAGVGLVAGLLLYLVPTPAASMGGWPLGYTLGAPASVQLGDVCEGRGTRAVELDDRTTCPDASWSVDGRSDSGTLYTKWGQVAATGELPDRVDARVFNGAAYLDPPAERYGLAVVPLALLGLGVLALVFTVPLRIIRRLTGDEPDWDVDGAMMLGVVGLALAASAGAAAGYLMAEDTNDRLGAGAVVVAAVVFVAWQLHKWRLHRRRELR
ncbi:hypothetical protein ABN028_10875 [Actinopolymorpha sp. B17G11]|uniref:hypothetical protein n=1 Tax=Actinopolymorpha sp. B17G11 TaxID=3160861 RepID=UPI0032E38AD9